MKKRRKREVAWEVLFRHFVNGTKVHIIKTLISLERPMSPSELAAAFDGADLTSVAYHARMLASLGVLECVKERQVRGGARQKFYDLAEKALI
jgi:predicted transcriptional regulator